MKLGFCTLAFRDADAVDAIRIAGELGFDEVEIIWKQLAGKSDAELDAIRDAAKEAGVGTSGISPYFWLTQNEELLAQSMQIATDAAHAARRLGARMIRTFTDAGPTGIGSEKATAAHWQVAIASLQTICALDPERLFALETHHNTLADTPAACERLLREVDRPNLQLIYQPFIAGDIIADYERLKPHVRHIHLNPMIGPAGDALADCGLDYAALLTHLRDSGFAHTCAIELCGPNGAAREQVQSELAWCRSMLNE